MEQSQAHKLKPLINNRSNWQLLEEYVADEKDRLVTRLHTCTEAELKDIQGELKALEKISRLPSQLETELRAKR